MTNDYYFFDTETTGIPSNYNAPYTNTDNWPRVVQVAWLVLDENQNVVSRNAQIIKPEGFVIPEGASRVHGITTQQALDNGKDLLGVMETFNYDALLCDTIAGHNVDFDYAIIGAEFVRLDMPYPLASMKRVDTMKSSTNYCKLPGNRIGSYKWPKLSELYGKLFNKPLENAHDALADIQATAECYFELKKLGVIA